MILVNIYTGLHLPLSSFRCTGDLCLSGSIIQKSRFIFTKERRTIRQKSVCLNHSNEGFFQVYLQIQGADYGFLEMGSICIKVWGFAMLILSHLS